MKDRILSDRWKSVVPTSGRLSPLILLIAALIGGCQKSQSPMTPTTNDPVEAKARTSWQMDASPAGKINFVDVAESSGVSWIGRNGEESGHFSILETFGAGCAVDDYDRDDKLDLFFAGGGHFGQNNHILPVPMALYRQISEWTFVSVTDYAQLHPIRQYHHGTWTIDFDEDGYSDLLLTGWDGLQLFHNQGDGTFADVTNESGLIDPLWSVPAGWGDFNRDQILDLYVGHYVDWSFENNPTCIDSKTGLRNPCDPNRFHGLPCTVYLGNGDGTFREASKELGVNAVGKALGVVIVDLNLDGQADLYVANDAVPNQLYMSQPSGNYNEVGIECGVALGESGSSDASMGVDVADLDGDGKLDLWVANYEDQTFALYRNLGNDAFTHASRSMGITAVGSFAVGFGTVIFDMDGDGYSDIFCTNGHVWAPHPSPDRRQFPYLFWNNRGRMFQNIAPQVGGYLVQRHLGRGAAVGDLDGNGTPDLVVTHTNEPAAILRNDTPVANWLSVRLIGRTSPRSAIGARVTIRAGGREQIGIVKGGASYLSTSDRALFFGLGNNGSIDSMIVAWPSGQTTVLKELASNQRMTLIERKP
jgi:enediyne biosynthesis protein E4